MANSAQAKKRARQSARRALANRAKRSRIRTFLRKVEESIVSDEGDARDALRSAESELMRGVTKGIMHRKTASRKVSRLAKRVRLSQQA